MRFNKGTIVLGFLLFLLICSSNVLAEVKPGAFTITPFIGGYSFEGDQGIDNDTTYGLGAGYNLGSNWGIEMVGNYVKTELDPDTGDIDVGLLRLDSLYHFMPTEKLVPYIGVGIGAIKFDPDKGNDDTNFLANYGAGIKYFFNETVALRADIRHIVSFDNTYNNFMYTLGLAFQFGGEKKKEDIPPADSDNDGVYDDHDKCPDTPAGISVNSKGCPLDSDKDGVFDYLDKCPDTPKGAPVDKVGCPLDSDKDGVFDYLDKCPDSPKGADVDANGCTIDADSDADGVSDSSDKCPGTPKGAKVDARGCWVIQGVQFDSGKWDIKPEFFPVLNEIFIVLENTPDLKVNIEGHTDSSGSPALNQTLSENRAKAIMEYLINKGIDSERLSAKGFGPSNPIGPNDTIEGRAQNRRVELKPIR